MNLQYNAPVFPVDTHVKRLTNRIGIANSIDTNKIEAAMHESVPKEYRSIASTWLVWHGRKVCKAQKPRCSECVLKNYCNYYKKE